MVIQKLIKGIVLSASLLLTFLAYASGPLLTIIPNPNRPNILLNPNPGFAIVEYLVTNQSSRIHTFAMMPNAGVFQNINEYGQCGYVHSLYPKASCLLSLTIDRSQLSQINGGPFLCPFNSSTTRGCVPPRPEHALTVQTLSPTFPYGKPPICNVCVTNPSLYATPESMLGSWAMIEAVNIDKAGGVLPDFLNPSNVVYAVGTAAIGAELGIPSCTTGCNELNGYCFALKFNGKTPYPYMIFQSVNIAANPSSFDIYMAGGGNGVTPGFCEAFWGTGAPDVNWHTSILGQSCDAYFKNFSTIKSAYSVTYNGVVHPAVTTLKDACTFASAAISGFNTANFSDVSIVPVTCPTSLTQITGIALSPSPKVGIRDIHHLAMLTDADFTNTPIPHVTTTQMQDCKTPSGGFCNNITAPPPATPTIPNYQSYISAELNTPRLSSTPPNCPYCLSHPGQGFCSWTNGQTSPGGYCNEGHNNMSAKTICLNGCGNNNPINHEWCTCDAQGNLVGCTANAFG
jgi:hypothetical protein